MIRHTLWARREIKNYLLSLDAEFAEVGYEVTERIVKAVNRKIILKFVANKNSIAGAFYNIRLLR